jgi:hypothetical protein
MRRIIIYRQDHWWIAKRQGALIRDAPIHGVAELAKWCRFRFPAVRTSNCGRTTARTTSASEEPDRRSLSYR